jgi:hypothetical protein
VPDGSGDDSRRINPLTHNPREPRRAGEERNKTMSDRVSASITIGGSITPAQFDLLAALICDEVLCLGWDGDLFSCDTPIPAEPLHLCAHEVPWGKFEALEQFCCDQGIAYRRWSGSFQGSFGAERIIFDGTTGSLNYDSDEDNRIMISAQTILHLGSMRAIRTYLKPTTFEVPPLIITDV